MNNEPTCEIACELIVTGSFNNLLPRLAELDYLEILITCKKRLREAKRQKIKPAMRMSEAIALTGMTKQDLEFLTSQRLLSTTEEAQDPLLSLPELYGLPQIISRMVREEVIG